ncbi:MAG TPA: acyl-CoA dehydrogenase family protein [Candidatus Binataceae bacterium]|nr:acyl-CoA dehydrogenase family protein [Candidatus Binataceae bacterium]
MSIKMETPDSLLVAPLLPLIAAQAAEADATRSVSPAVITALKGNDVMRMSATRNIGGLESSISAIGRELEAVAAACGSTGWCLWNHLCVFHFYCGLLGAAQISLLRSITANRHWVCLPAGAGTGVIGRKEGEEVVLNGVASFGSGGRYSDYAGITFIFEGERAPHLTLVRTDQPGVRIDPTWKAMSLRASATDHVHYEEVRASLASVVPFPMPYRVAFRDPAYPMIDHRYREDWVALSDLWLGCMAVGVADAALKEACSGIQGRVAIMGVKMVERPTIHVNLGQAVALIGAARAAIYDACAKTDGRIAAHQIPTEADYLEQLGASMMALRLCDEAMRLILRVLGGNGLREGQSFERRYRDYQAMPLHINAHPDRVSEQLGRYALGLPTENPF